MTELSGRRSSLLFFGDPAAADEHPADANMFGGKGMSLIIMSRAGLPVPPGFIVASPYCRVFLESGGSWPEGLQDAVFANLSRLEKVTGCTFGRGPTPLLVSVRSGAAVSMPGMMETILNCGLTPDLVFSPVFSPCTFWRLYADFIAAFARSAAGLARAEFDAIEGRLGAEFCRSPAEFGATENETLARRFQSCYETKTGRAFPIDPFQQLFECIEAVFRSWNSDRAIAYRKHHDLRGLHGTAVTVQAMFPSQVSGVAFTANPARPDAGEMIIEAAPGLGEAVVSGAASPDRFIVDAQSLEIKQTHAGDRPSLAPPQVAELAALARRVEMLFGHPVDLEWGWADGTFALLQARPIRKLDIVREIQTFRAAEIERLVQRAGGSRRVWVVHNLGETLRAPTPLTWDIVRTFMSGEGGFGRMYQDFGFRPGACVRSEGFLELIGSRIYADLGRAAELFWDTMPLEYDVDCVRNDRELLNAPPSRFNAEKADARFWLHLPGTVWAMIRCARRMRRLREGILDEFETKVLPPFLHYVAEKRAQNLSAFSAPDLIAELHDRRRRVLDDFGKESLKPGYFGGMALAALRRRFGLLLGEKEGTRLALALTSALLGDLAVKQEADLLAVARGEATLADFLEAYGHRAVGEMELAVPRWREDPAYLIRLAAFYQSHLDKAAAAAHEANRRKREETERALPELLRQYGGSSFAEEIERDLRDAQRLLPYRENGKHYLMMGYETIRQVIVELGRRWDLGRDVFFLCLDELQVFEKKSETLRKEIHARKTRHQALRGLELPDVIDSHRLDELERPRGVEGARERSGVPIAPGVGTGPARIVFDPADPRDLGTHYVLVCPSTDPAWTLLFAHARALVVERGGLLSHGAIVARDFCIPAVVCAEATRLFRDGEIVRVDGDRGVVQVLPQGSC